MRRLNLVKQLDNTGCTIACLSMIAEIPYFELRNILHSNVSRFKNAVALVNIGLYPNEFRSILSNQFCISSRFIKFVSLGELRRHCVLFLRPIVFDSTEHAVVYDAKTKTIFDPSGKNINIDDYNVCTCIEIIEAEFDSIIDEQRWIGRDFCDKFIS